MSNATATKLNTGYFDVVCKGKYDVFAAQRGRRKISANEIFIEGSIESYGSIEGFRTFFAEKLNCGIATVSRVTSKLVKNEKITLERLPNGKTKYQSARDMAQEKREAPFYRIYNFFFTHKFEFQYKEKKDENGNVVRPACTITRQLTSSEVLVLSLIFTHCKNHKSNKQYFWSSYAKIADMLALSERQVERAVNNLRAARLIFRPVRGQSRVRNSKFVANMKVLCPLCEFYAVKKVQKQEKTSAKPAYIAEIDARSDRERYYAIAKRRSEDKAESYKRAFIKKAPRFAEIEKEILALAYPLAKAEIHNFPTLGELQAKETVLQKERAAILKRFNVDERHFEACAWAHCRYCGDTGTLPDGRMCTCWNQEEGEGELN